MYVCTSGLLYFIHAAKQHPVSQMVVIVIMFMIMLFQMRMFFSVINDDFSLSFSVAELQQQLIFARFDSRAHFFSGHHLFSPDHVPAFGQGHVARIIALHALHDDLCLIVDDYVNLMISLMVQFICERAFRHIAMLFVCNSLLNIYPAGIMVMIMVMICMFCISKNNIQQRRNDNRNDREKDNSFLFHIHVSGSFMQMILQIPYASCCLITTKPA